ncbi:putative permease [Thermoplasmatales archaeon BRNA1]|nr:putative permease [Thermoplasmatales archaeon BRNA1]
MEPLLLCALLVIAVGAGIIGALFGLGGGIIFIPVLTILFDLSATEAVAASLVGIVATSTGSAYHYVNRGLSNIRLGMMLEITTSVGAIIGAAVAVYLENWILLAIFACVMLYSGFKMAVSPEKTVSSGPSGESEMSFSYEDAVEGEVRYTVQNTGGGMAVSTIAGMVSSMTGVGGGSIKVPIMNIYMHVPIKAASATSSYMIGITAFSGAVIYFIEGVVLLDVAAAVAVGAYIGAMIGSRIATRVSTASIKRCMPAVYFCIAAIMFLKAGGIL